MKKPIRYKQSPIQLICELVRGRDVLDVGCGDKASDELSPLWLHKHIVKVAHSVLGLDLAEDAVKKLQDKGYNVVCGDAVTVDLKKRFNAIVAGDIIEHIDNPGIFLENMKRHLSPGGLFIIATPNVFFLLHFLESIFCSPCKRWHPHHVHWYDYSTLESLLRQHGFDIVNYYYTTRSKKLLKLMRLTSLACYSFLASTIVFVAQLSEPSGLNKVSA